jgi:endonuclease/exonuclease/phosphatase family metal-dependent hydrolase
MKKKVLVILMFLLISGLGYGQNSIFNVMTYNIWYAKPDAGENIWENRRDGVAKVVIDQKADIVGMQEVLFRQLIDLENLLPGYQWVGVGRDDGKQGGEFAPIFFNQERFGLVLTGNFWLSETPDSAGSLGWDGMCIRIATWAQLKDKNSGFEFFVFNTHFDHEGETARLESSKLLIKKISEIAGDLPVVLTGDFNCLKDSQPYHLLVKSLDGLKMVDCRYSTIEKPSGPDYSFVGSEFTGEPGNIIDHIFISDNIKVHQSKIIENCKNGKCPSDHLPVMTTIEIPGN